MVLRIALILAFIFQLAAAVIAIRLVKATKYNVAWFLLLTGLLCMAVLRFWDIFSRIMYGKQTFSDSYVWLGVLSSFCFAVGVFFVWKILIYIRNINDERRQLENKFRTAIIQTEEKERTHFAKEMHDGIGPLLSTAKLAVGVLYLTEQDEQQKKLIKNMENILNEAIKSIKEISNDLSPHVLTSFGLETAILNFINKINRISSLQINFTNNIQNIRFDSDLEVSLYRIICELINNTIQHAQATQIAIDVLLLPTQQIRVLYTDDGIGFDTAKIAKDSSTGIGFSSIYSRVDLFKGQIEIQSNLNEGAAIIISIPVKYAKT